MSDNLVNVLKQNRVIPVAAFNDPQKALKTAELLLENSINILEITLRTDEAYASIEAVVKKYPEMAVGAGSVLSSDALKKASSLGASFFVAPASDMRLIDYAADNDLDFIPGISTPTELQNVLDKASVIKIFPASHLGGPAYIKAITAPFRMKEFYLVPTGGVNESNYLDYLQLDRVISCGMSYIVDSTLVSDGDFPALELRIRSIASGLQ